MERQPIRIRLVPREPVRNQENAREAFWRAIRRSDNQEQEISVSEGKLCREFGPALREMLIRELSEPLRSIEDTMFHREIRDFEHILFAFSQGPKSERGLDQAQALDAFTRLLEQRQKGFQDIPALRNIQEKLAVASSVTFSIRIAGYSSLNLDLSVGSLQKIAKVFENDFDSFRVFLEAFIPKTFANVFRQDEANRVKFEVDIPETYKQAFNRDNSKENAIVPLSTNNSSAGDNQVNTSRERAEWLWRLANGSLLIPLILALAVMYYGMSMFENIRVSQNDALKPLLEHQLKLLEEDRKRIFKDSSVTPASTSSPAPAK